MVQHVAATALLTLSAAAAFDIDFRYPDYIVHPLVDCPTEGVFPHPRDCHWYYRCHDRYNRTQQVGLPPAFWRNYFQCEPGTEFSDELDQCVFKGDRRGCNAVDTCGENHPSCQSGRVCGELLPNATGPAFVRDTKLCKGSTRTCSGVTKEICASEEVYDFNHKECIPERYLNCPSNSSPSNDNATIICQHRVDSCKDVQVCRDGGAPSRERHCAVVQVCTRRKEGGSVQEVTDYCNPVGSAAMVFDARLNRCVPSPGAADACPDAVADRPVGGCSRVTERCRVVEECTHHVYFLACDGYFQCPSDRRRRALCPLPGQLYAPTLGRCVDNSAVKLGRSSKSQCVDTDLDLSPGTIEDEINKIDCTERPPEYVPYAQGHPDLGCTIRLFCDDTETAPRVETIGCDNYFKCETDVKKPQLLTCPDNMYFDYSTKKCVDPQIKYGRTYKYCENSTLQITVNYTINCNREGEIPELSNEARRSVCDSGISFACEGDVIDLSREFHLCRLYYQCELTGGRLKAMKKYCDEGSVFDLTVKKCIPQPKICGSFVMRLLEALQDGSFSGNAIDSGSGVPQSLPVRRADDPLFDSMRPPRLPQRTHELTDDIANFVKLYGK